MDYREWRIASLTLVGAGVCIAAGYIAWLCGMKSADLASWVQAIGSIAAIAGAVWIASEQHRRDVLRRQAADLNASYLLRAELAWLSGDVVQFLNQFVHVKQGQFYREFVFTDEDVSDLLSRMSWCRQRVEHKGQLAMLGALREPLIKTASLFRSKTDDLFSFNEHEISNIKAWRKMALDVYNHANGIDHVLHYSP